MTIPWTDVGGWMAFDALSVSDGITRAFTLGYRITDGGGEPWTSRFNRFKAKDKAAYWGGAFLMYAAVPKLLLAMKIDPAESVFITALSSGETTATPDRFLPVITKECAKIVGAKFELKALTKNAHGQIHNLYKVDERRAELDKANYKCSKLDRNHVFVFDDIITRGDTLSRTALAILAENPGAKVYGVALAKAERTMYCPNSDNGHVPPAWGKAWQEGEAEQKKKGG